MMDEDYLVISTIHSAKGMEWDNVYILNVVDGSFPSEFATGKAELIEEERRLLYVAMTRARNELTCVMPLRFQITSQPKTSDGHVYGGRSRFLTEKVMKCFDEQTFQGSNVDVKIEETAGGFRHHRRGVAPQADVVSGRSAPQLPENGARAAPFELIAPRTDSGTVSWKRGLTPISAAERSAATLARTRRTFLRFVHAQGTSAHLVSVETLDRGLCFAGSHLNETESTGLARFTVVDQLYGIDLAMALEEHLDVLLGCGEGQIAHVDRRHPRLLAQKADSGRNAAPACTADN